FQVNLTPGNILTGSFLYNLSDRDHVGLSFLNPIETTTWNRQTLYVSSLRDQVYLGHGALLDLGFADTRTLVRTVPEGDQIYQMTPFGNRGNYFVNQSRHAYRQQALGNVFLPVLHFHGSHQVQFGADFEREAFHEEDLRHPYEILRQDES